MKSVAGVCLEPFELKNFTLVESYLTVDLLRSNAWNDFSLLVLSDPMVNLCGEPVLMLAICTVSSSRVVLTTCGLYTASTGGIQSSKPSGKYS